MDVALSPSALADQLIPLEVGQALDLPFLTPSQNQAVRFAAMKRGFGVSLKRNANGGFTATKMPHEWTSHHRVNRDAVCSAIASGRTYREVAKEYGLSFQRVDQIVSTHDAALTSLPPGRARVEALDAVMRPYVEMVNHPFALCVMCGGDSPDPGTAGVFCETCRPKFRAIREVASYIRSWRRNGERNYLSMALVRIRKFKLTPSDMEWQ